PEDDHYGLSALEPSAFAVGIHNSAADWNKALLDNAARPSGALLFEPTDGTPANLSDEQFKRLKAELEDNYQGAINAGRPFLLEGGLKWHNAPYPDLPINGAGKKSKRFRKRAHGSPSASN
ncbi:MAG: phage portal protein, partial [Sphingomonadales bacterium]